VYSEESWLRHGAYGGGLEKKRGFSGAVWWFLEGGVVVGLGWLRRRTGDTVEEALKSLVFGRRKESDHVWWE